MSATRTWQDGVANNIAEGPVEWPQLTTRHQ
jgi:hypothetical protein